MISPPWLQPMMPTRVGVDVVVVLQHPLPAGEDVLDLQPAVVDQLPEFLAVAAAAAVVRGDDRVALLEQLAQDVDVAAVEVAVDSAVNEDDERQLLLRRYFRARTCRRG